MMDRDEQALVRASVSHVLATPPAEALPDRLLQSGWGELLEEHPAAAVGILAEEHGRSLKSSPALDLVLLHAAGQPLDSTTAVVLPPLRRGFPLAATMSESSVSVDGLVLAGHERAGTLVASTDAGLVAVAAASVRFEPVAAGDPDLGLHRATTEIPVAEAAVIASSDDWTRAVTVGRRFLASELVGLSSRMLDDTVEYVLDRQQFGRQIGSFQTVKHRLADVRVATEAARSALDTAWADDDALSAMATKCLAGKAHRLASTHCHQVHGGIAFTVEHGFHRMIRRGQLLDGLLGASHDLAEEIGRQLLRARHVPRTPQLGE